MARKDAYPREFKERAVALYRTSGRSMDAVAKELGISSTSLANWNRQAAIDAGERPGIVTEDRARWCVFVETFDGWNWRTRS
ncbi:transposase [Microbacterium sp. CH12i]|uniref:transposase n=1 Tax=Microbacterium sp. CH12i TaxID=1479651 RepID=UPI00136329A4|nr:transposase [Microbacterium sp. CH12i]